MSIPDFQTIMLPLLRHFGDGKDHPNQETHDALASEFGVSAEEQARLLPSGAQTVFKNRIAWAKAHFKKAGLIEAPTRAVYRITTRGRDVLRDAPDRIDLKFLDRFPEHRAFRTSVRKSAALESSPEDEVASSEDEMTPEEHIALGYQQLREQLADEILQKIKECPPAFFEQLVIDLLLAMGYGGSRREAGKAIGRAGDGGIDGIINEDKLGLDVIYVQAKRWESSVGRPEIQKFAGALHGQRARKGIFITTAGFSKDAREYAAVIDMKIILIDGEELANLMIDHNVGVATVDSYTVKRLDSDYFTQE
jgi:restriction system protein